MRRPDPMERDTFIRYIATLKAHVEALSAQVVGLGGVPTPVPDGSTLIVSIERALEDAAGVTVLPLPAAPIAPDADATPAYPSGRRQRRAPGEDPRVLRSLRALGECTIEHLAAHAGTTPNAMQQELGRYRDQVARRRDGRRVWYSLKEQP